MLEEQCRYQPSDRNLNQHLSPLPLLDRMKLAGLLLMVAGWIIAVTAIALIPKVNARAAFLIAGIAVEALGIALAVRGHHPLRSEP